MLKISRDQVPARRQLMINPFLAGNSNFSFKKSKFRAFKNYKKYTSNELKQ